MKTSEELVDQFAKEIKDCLVCEIDTIKDEEWYSIYFKCMDGSRYRISHGMVKNSGSVLGDLELMLHIQERFVKGNR